MKNRSQSAFSPFRFAKSLGHALSGVWILIKSEPNARIHLLATVVVVGLGLYLQLDGGDWVVVVLVIAMVWAAEGFNSAIEALTDLASAEKHPLAKRTKDLAAGAVLLATIGAAIVGVIIFLPKLFG